MKKLLAVVLGASVIVSVAILACGQQDAEKNSPRKHAPNLGNESATALAQRPLVLSGSVPMDGVKGRFDHFASGKDRVFISALGNNTVEVINLFGGIVERTITGVTNPQGVRCSRHRTRTPSRVEKITLSCSSYTTLARGRARRPR